MVANLADGVGADLYVEIDHPVLLALCLRVTSFFWEVGEAKEI